MKLDSFEQYFNRMNTKYPNNHGVGRLLNIASARDIMMERYPYVVTISGDHYDVDNLENVIRQHLGHRDGVCEWILCNEYPRDEKEFDQFIETLLKIGMSRPSAIIYAEKTSNWSIEHSHDGVWNRVFLTKTGYDYGMEDFYFRTQESAEWFHNFMQEGAKGV